MQQQMNGGTWQSSLFGWCLQRLSCCICHVAASCLRSLEAAHAADKWHNCCCLQVVRELKRTTYRPKMAVLVRTLGRRQPQLCTTTTGSS